MKNNGKKWTNEDVEFLKNNYPKYGSEYCSKKLLRDKKAIIKRANILKIKFEGTSFKYLKENLEPIIKSSLSISDVLRNLGLKAIGGSHETIKSYIKKYNINTDHFKAHETKRIMLLANNGKMAQIPLEKILTTNSNYSRFALKKRLVSEKLLEYKCCDCGNTGEWNGKLLSLQLDHENGINNDNRIENLRFMCPNCHSQTSTFAGKSNKKKEVKIDKRRINTENRVKSNIDRRKIRDRPSKEQLKKEVVEFGYSATGRKYGVSDNAIRKWIKSYEKYGI